MALTRTRKRALALGGAFVAVAAAVAMTVVLPASATTPTEIVLHLDGTGRYFRYGTGTDAETQNLSTSKNGSCQINSPESIVHLSSAPTSPESFPGLGPDGIGVKQTKSSSNGTPCSQVAGTEKLTVALKNSTTTPIAPIAGLRGRSFTGLRLDLELTGNAFAKLTLTKGSATREYVLQTGPNMLSAERTEALAMPPGEAYSSDGDRTDGCAIASSSGPNSGPNDNCLWTVTPTFEFDSFTLEALPGTVALEGAGDFGGSAAHETVLYLDQGPTAVNDTYSVAEDGTLEVDGTPAGLLANDTPNAGLTATKVADPANGTVTDFDSSDGTFTYTPGLNFNGTDTFTYTVSDGTETSNTATVTITVNPVNDGPDAVADTDKVNMNGSVDINVLANDTDPDGDDLTVASTSGVTTGAFASPNGTGGVTYTPPPDFTGEDSFSYTVTDDSLTDTATVTVAVLPVICGSQTVGVADPEVEPEEGPQVTGFFTLLSDNTQDCKGYALEADVEAQEGRGTIRFVPNGGGTRNYRGVLTFPADEVPVAEYPLLLQYDPDGGDDFKPVQWCIDPVFEEGLVTGATLPGDQSDPEDPDRETWCVAKAVTTPGDGGLVTTWQVYGEDDPQFMR